MALTLPYPGLVFVPLDILTAEEQNEIVANYTYIANQFPIGPTNIDWDNFPTAAFSHVTSNAEEVNTAVDTDILVTSQNVTSGKYLVIATVSFSNADSVATGECSSSIYLNNSAIDTSISFMGSGDNYSGCRTTNFAIMDFTASGTISLKTHVYWPQRGKFIIPAHQAKLCIVKIAEA